MSDLGDLAGHVRRVGDLAHDHAQQLQRPLGELQDLRRQAQAAAEGSWEAEEVIASIRRAIDRLEQALPALRQAGDRAHQWAGIHGGGEGAGVGDTRARTSNSQQAVLVGAAAAHQGSTFGWDHDTGLITTIAGGMLPVPQPPPPDAPTDAGGLKARVGVPERHSPPSDWEAPKKHIDEALLDRAKDIKDVEEFFRPTPPIFTPGTVQHPVSTAVPGHQTNQAMPGDPVSSVVVGAAGVVTVVRRGWHRAAERWRRRHGHNM